MFLSAHPSSRSTLDPTTTPFDAASDDAFRRRLDVIRDDVSLRFEDGSECVVADADPDRLIPSENSSLFPDEEQCPYFPGLVCHASASVCGTRKAAETISVGLGCAERRRVGAAVVKVAARLLAEHQMASRSTRETNAGRDEIALT